MCWRGGWEEVCWGVVRKCVCVGGGVVRKGVGGSGGEEVCVGGGRGL